MELQTVHRRVREARAETGLSQKAFAQKVGVAREVLARWENGETKRPDVAKLSKATGKPVDWFWRDEHPQPEAAAESTVPYTAAPTTVEQLTQIVGTLTRLVETSQEQQARLLDHQDKLLARLQQAQDQLDKGLDMRAELDKRDAKIATLEGKILAAGAPDSPAVRRLAQ